MTDSLGRRSALLALSLAVLTTGCTPAQEPSPESPPQELARSHAVTDPPGSVLPMHRVAEPRVPPLPVDEWTDEQRGVVEKYAPEGDPGSALATLARIPPLADRVFPFLRYVVSESTLSPRQRALLILRTAWLTQSSNLWATHASHTGDAVLTDEEVLNIARGKSAGWSELEAALLGFADELFRHSAVTDATWDRLSQELSVHNMIDGVVTVGHMLAMSGLFNSLGIQPDAETTARLPTSSVDYELDVPKREPLPSATRVEPVAGDDMRVMRTFRRHLEMNAALFASPGYLLNPERSRLTPHDRELLILRTLWNTQSLYDWGKHVGSFGQAPDVGLDPPQIAQGADATGWDANELALINAANEMYRDTMISDETWADLSTRYDTHQMISMAATAAMYRRNSIMVNAWAVQPLPTDAGFPILEP